MSDQHFIRVEASRIPGKVELVETRPGGFVVVSVFHMEGIDPTRVQLTPAEAMALLGAVEMGSEVVVVKTITIERPPATKEEIEESRRNVCTLLRSHEGPHRFEHHSASKPAGACLADGGLESCEGTHAAEFDSGHEQPDEEPVPRCHRDRGHNGECEFVMTTEDKVDCLILCGAVLAPERDATIRRNGRPVCGAMSHVGIKCTRDPDHDGPHQNPYGYFSEV